METDMAVKIAKALGLASTTVRTIRDRDEDLERLNEIFEIIEKLLPRC